VPAGREVLPAAIKRPPARLGQHIVKLEAEVALQAMWQEAPLLVGAAVGHQRAFEIGAG
jgi:hypothetical protein